MRNLLAVFVVGALAACASGGRLGTPTGHFQPAAGPLRHQLADDTNVSVETPQGDMRSRDTSTATIRMTVGQAGASGHAITAAYEALDLRSAGDMGSSHVTGGALLGQEFAGTLKPSGMIEINSSPTVPSNIKQYLDPAAWLKHLLVPLPPAGTTADSWPVRVEVASDAGMQVTTRYEGTARFAGDTTWNGITARRIVLEGQFTFEGRGQPAGAPAELVMLVVGTTTRRYLWDAQRGVMLHAHAVSEGQGTMEMVGMDVTLPTSVRNELTVVIVP